MSAHENTAEEDDTVERLRALDRANVGRTVLDDEVISGVCESAIEEIERLRAALTQEAAFWNRHGPGAGA